MIKLNQDEINEKLITQSGWKLVDEIWLENKFRFKDYLKGIEFVNLVAERSEEVNHHPFISIDYKLITVKISSWQARGLTNLDFQLVEEYDQIYNDLK
jgi:4a-hydroxytetrahydrobiopterin dehydratase